jgi:hypothetical protein
MGVKTNGISFSYVEYIFFLFNNLSSEVVVRLLILVTLVTITV